MSRKPPQPAGGIIAAGVVVLFVAHFFVARPASYALMALGVTVALVGAVAEVRKRKRPG